MTIRCLFLFLFACTLTASAQITHSASSYRFVAVMKDGRSLPLKSRLDFDNKAKTEFVNFKDQRIYPPATDFLLRIKGRDTIRGYPMQGGFWLFRVIQGDLNCFTYLPEVKNAILNQAMADKHLWLSKNDTSLVPFSKTELQQMISDKPLAVRDYRIRRTAHKLGLWVFIGGMTLGSTIAALSKTDEGETYGARIAGSAFIFIIPTWMYLYWKPATIRKYNTFPKS